MQSPPYDATLIAKYFIHKGKRTRDVTPMKLQKLVYFAHGIYMAEFGGQPLIKEFVEAWQYGPVIPSIYHKFKWFARRPILKSVDEKAWILSGLQTLEYDLQKLDKETKSFLDAIWRAFKNYSAYELSDLTHREGSPWYEVYKDRPEKKGSDIPEERIAEYFASMK